MIARTLLIGAAASLLALPVPTLAQDGIRCSNFLHNRDGTWRSFSHADLFGPNGVVHVDEGDILNPSARSAKGDVARALNDVCAQ